MNVCHPDKTTLGKNGYPNAFQVHPNTIFSGRNDIPNTCIPVYLTQQICGALTTPALPWIQKFTLLI